MVRNKIYNKKILKDRHTPSNLNYSSIYNDNDFKKIFYIKSIKSNVKYKYFVSGILVSVFSSIMFDFSNTIFANEHYLQICTRILLIVFVAIANIMYYKNINFCETIQSIEYDRNDQKCNDNLFFENVLSEAKKRYEGNKKFRNSVNKDIIKCKDKNTDIIISIRYIDRQYYEWCLSNVFLFIAIFFLMLNLVLVNVMVSSV